MGAAAVPIVVGGGMKIAGEMMEANDKATALEQEAIDAAESAIMAREAGRYNAERQQIAGAKALGSMRSDYGASGISSDSISAMEVLRESTINAELDRQNILFGAETKARNYENRARAAKAGAGSSRTAGTLSAFGTLFGMGGSLADKYG